MFKAHSSTIWAGGKVVGEVAEGKFIKRVRGSRHMLREPKGWAVDVQSLADAEELGAASVEIVDVETDVTYSATIARIQEKGFRLDRGHGAQVAVPLRLWSVSSDDARQLSLFGV